MAEACDRHGPRHAHPERGTVRQSRWPGFTILRLPRQRAALADLAQALVHGDCRGCREVQAARLWHGDHWHDEARLIAPARVDLLAHRIAHAARLAAEEEIVTRLEARIPIGPTRLGGK